MKMNTHRLLKYFEVEPVPNCLLEPLFTLCPTAPNHLISFTLKNKNKNNDNNKKSTLF